jgi:hypothetical protein
MARVAEKSAFLTSVFRLLGLRIWMCLAFPCALAACRSLSAERRGHARACRCRVGGEARLRERTSGAKPQAAWAKGGAGGAVVAPWSRGDSVWGAGCALGVAILT